MAIVTRAGKGSELTWNELDANFTQLAPLDTPLFVSDITIQKTSGIGIKVDVDDPTFSWRDLEGVLRPDPVGANAPTLAAFRGGAVREFFYAANDMMDMDFHIPHDYVPGSDLYAHIHWSHNGTAISGNMVATLTSTYAKRESAIFPAEKVTTVTYATVNIGTTPQYIHRVDEVPITSSGGSATLWDNAIIEPDGIIMMNMTITTIPTITGGSRNEPVVFYCDIHYQSTNTGTKQNASPFWT